MVKARKQARSRELMLEGTIELLRERGYGGLGLREVMARSGAPRGSIYHHFPGGKAQLAEEGVRAVGAQVGDALEASRDADPIELLRGFARTFGASLEATGFRLGCPVAGAANEFNEDSARVAEAAAGVFERWERLIAASLRRHGVPRTRASRLAALTVASIEGATLMCRAARSTKPLEHVALELEAAIEAARGGT